MRIHKTYIILLFSLFLTVGRSQDNPDIVSRVATSAANWLKIETGTKAIGMAGAYSAVEGGLTGVLIIFKKVLFFN